MGSDSIPQPTSKITGLLEKALPDSTARGGDNTDLIKQLEGFNYRSVFDVIRVGRMRFIRRHAHHFSGHAEEIFQNSLSFATQLIQQTREQGLRTADHLRLQSIADGSAELPDYAALFPEPWDNFCNVGALEALNSPIAYLLELYQFARQLELDATEGALTLAKRRPDLASLLLDADNTHQDIPAIQVVNEILGFLAADHIDTTEDTGKSVNEVLARTYYPFGLPFSLPTMQINLGLAEKKTSLAQVIRLLSNERLWFAGTMPANQQNSSLLAATGLSREQMKLLSDPGPFAMESLTLPRLRNAYLSGSTTEARLDLDLSDHGYIIPSQTGAQGPVKLTHSAILPSLDAHDVVTVTGTNALGETVDIKLRAKAVLTYKRPKTRLKPFNELPPYPRQLELSWHDADNAHINLAKGPYQGKFTVHVQDWLSDNTIQALTFDIAIANADISPSKYLADSETFFMKYYGITLDQLESLPQVKFFIDQVEGSAQETDQALALGDFSPVASPNITFINPIFTNGQSQSPFPMPYQAGAAYLNAGHPQAIGINTARPRSMTNTTAYRFDRLNRLLRLARWLKLPHQQLDLLLTCAIQAEGENNVGFTISFNTLRVLGLYRYLNESVNLDAESCAALIYSLTPFGVSASTPFFDRVFNQPQLFDVPLSIDNTAFNYKAQRGDDSRTIKQLCAGLKINTATFQVLAKHVNGAFGLEADTLVRSLAIISALYRLVTVARLFKLSPEQGIMVVDLLSRTDRFSQLLFAGAPVLSPLAQDGQSTTQVDMIDIIFAVEEMANWLKQSTLTPEELSLITQQQRLPVVATDNSAIFFDSILQGIKDTQLTPYHFIAPDIPDKVEIPGTPGTPETPKPTKPLDWMSLLSPLISTTGLVMPLPLQWAGDEEAYLDSVLTPIVLAALIPSVQIPAVVSALIQIIQQAKTRQEGLVSSAVNKEYGVSREAVPLQLRWIGYSVTDFLQKLLAYEAEHSGRIQHAHQVSDELLKLAYNLALSAVLIKKLRLTPALLFMRMAQPQWLNMVHPSIHNRLSLEEVYLLSRYRSWVAASQHSEEELIEYMAYANSPTTRHTPAEIDRNCAELLADILEWEPDEIEVACLRFTPARARSIEQIDWLRRTMALSRQTGLSVTSLIEAAQLASLPEFTQIESVGEAVIAATQSQGSEQVS